MPERDSFDYATLRIVPRVDREEFINAGVILFCSAQNYLDARIHLDESRLRALWTEVDVDLVRQHLEAFPKICEGDPHAGPIAALSRRQRFHWLVSPRSTMIQVSPVHSGLCELPEPTLDALFSTLVLGVDNSPGTFSQPAPY